MLIWAKGRSSKHFITTVIIAAIFIPLVILAIASARSSAANTSNFDAGRIIDDAVFYNSGAMSAPQIQSFLNSKVSVCDTYGTQIYSGTTTRAAYSATRGYSTPFTCLKDYSATTTAKAADAYCNGYTSGTQTAAQMIYGVSQSCGINPEVLIVLLQKEQGLVMDTWPWSIQYRSATGYGCPDSGSCDSQYYGLFNQLYNAARQFKLYRALPNSYSYVAGRNNTILWNPATSCGSSTVYIQNQATAGLYNYTPYRPNQAALNAGYGTGDSCSSYGNRNFWLYFTDWFGSTITTTPQSNVYIQDGTYTVASTASGRVIDAVASGEINGTGIEINNDSASATQTWKISRDSSGYYSFQNTASGKYIDVPSASIDAGTSLQLWDGNGSCAQKWAIVSSGSSLSILSKCSGLAIDIPGGSTVAGTLLQTWNENSTTAQQWSFIAHDTAPVANGDYAIGLSSGLKLDIQGGAVTSGARVQIYNQNGTNAQRWTLTRLSDGSYTINNTASGKVLDVVDGAATSGARVQIYNQNGTCAQRWYISIGTSGSFVLRSGCSGLALDVMGGAITTATTPLQIYTQNGSAAQNWQFTNWQSIADQPTTLSKASSILTAAGQALDVTGGSTAAGARVQIYNQNGTNAQRWTLTRLSDGSYTINNTASGKYLDVINGAISSGSRIQTWDGNGSCAQKWNIAQNADSTYIITNACSSKVALDVVSGRISVPSSPVQIYTSNQTLAQKWIIK